MAIAKRRTTVANPVRRRKRNGPRKMSAKQIKHFGTAAQKAALKRSRSAKRAAKHRKRTQPNAPRRTNRARRVVSGAHRRKRRTVKRKNTGAIIHYALGSALNPASGKAGKMARTRRRKNRSTHRSHRRTRANAPRRRRAAVTVRRRRRNGSSYRRVARRSNPFGGSWGSEVMTAATALGGFVASKLGAQALLGTSNVGPMGYAATLAVGGVGAWALSGPMKNKKAAASFFTGSVIAVVAKLIQDYTPLGSYLSQAGVGDASAAGFGAYLQSNWSQPQIYSDAVNSAMVRIPQGWGGGAPTAIVQSAAPPADMQASAGMGSLYGAVGSGGGLYS